MTPAQFLLVFDEGESPNNKVIDGVSQKLENILGEPQNCRVPVMVFGQTLLLGDNLLPLLTLALGGALVVGNAAALLRPPAHKPGDGDLEQPPLVRTLVFITFGLIMTIWALASLL